MWVDICVWVPTKLAAQQNRVSLGRLAVVSVGPSSPLRAAGQVVCLRGTGWALELAERSKLDGPPVSHQPGQRASQGCQVRQAR